MNCPQVGQFWRKSFGVSYFCRLPAYISVTFEFISGLAKKYYLLLLAGYKTPLMYILKRSSCFSPEFLITLSEHLQSYTNQYKRSFFWHQSFCKCLSSIVLIYCLKYFVQKTICWCTGGIIPTCKLSCQI